MRGEEEHRQLKISQLERVADAPRYVYVENGSKNRSGGLEQLQVQNKVVPIDAVPEARNRCYVYVLDFCLQKLPPEAFENKTSISNRVHVFLRIRNVLGLL